MKMKNKQTKQANPTPIPQSRCPGRQPAALLLVLLCLTLLPLLGSCRGEQDFLPRSYTPDGQAVTGVTVDVADRTVEIVPSSDGQLRLSCHESRQEYYSVSVSDSGELTIELVRDKDWTDYIGLKAPAEYRVLRLELPDSLTAGLTVRTTNGDVSLSPLTVGGNVSLEVNGGSLYFEELRAGGGLRLTAKNGDIAGSLCGSREEFAVRCTVKKGESNLVSDTAAQGRPLEVDCNNGDVRVDFLP